MIYTTFVCIIASIGAGFGTGFAGISTATIIAPLLIGLLDVPAYQAVGVALAADVLASAATARTYARSKNIDIKNGLIMLVSVLVMTALASVLASYMPDMTMSFFSVIMTSFLGLKFLVWPVTNTPEKHNEKTARRRIIESLVSGLYIGFICGFIGAGGGMMMLFVLTSILGYELKTAVGTSVFVMTFTAFTGAVSHIALGGIPSLFILVECIVVTLIAAKGSAVIANHAPIEVLNKITGYLLLLTGLSMTALQVYEHFFS